MQTADGIPYWKIALLHLDSIASTVVQKCIYWDTPEQCGFCGIELTRGEQTISVKTPAQLAEVCTAARDYDHAVDVTLTTGSLNRRDRGAIYISRCAAAIKEACGLPIQVQFEPPDDLRVLDEVRRAGVDAVGHPLRDVRPRRAGAGRAGQGPVRHRGLLPDVGAGGRGVRPRQRDDLRAARHGRAPGADPGRLPAGDRDGRLPVRGAAAAGSGDADGRHADAGPGLRRPRSTARWRRCSRTPGSTTWTPRRAARAARRARGCRRGSGCCAARTGTGSMTSSWAPTTSAALSVASGEEELAAHFAVRQPCSSRRRGCSRARTATTATRARKRCTWSPGWTARSSARCGSIPWTAPGCGRATGWPSCPAPACTAWAGELVRFAVRDGGRARRRAHGGPDPAGQRALLRAARVVARRRARALLRRHPPADGDPLSAP